MKHETILKKAKKQLTEIEKIWGTDKVRYIKEIIYIQEKESRNE